MARSFKFILFLSLFLSSCDNNVVFKKYSDDFQQSQWLKSDIRTYEFELKSEGNYDIEIIFSHIYDTPLDNIPILVQFISASGETESKNIIIRLRDDENRHIGDCAGDYCDVEFMLYKNRKLNSGKYIITLANQFDYQYMPNVIGVGVKVSKSTQ